MDESGARHSEKIQALRNEVDELKKESATSKNSTLQNYWNIGNSIAIAIIMWFMFGSNPK
jgi:hypothetical protein